jgi:hypothetical protein
MSFKDIILIILSYCGLKFADKFIEDNIPNLHYKKLISAFNKQAVPLFAIAYLGWLSLNVKITRSPQLKKEYFELLVILVTIILLNKKYQHKKTISNIY